MRTWRWVTMLTLLGLLLGGTLVTAPRARAVGDWTPVASRPLVRAERTGSATRLADGRVLVIGTYSNTGDGRAGGTAWLYDPAADRWTPAAAFDPNNGNANPVLLTDGRVLFAGGGNVTPCISPGCRASLRTAQVYDPAADIWTPVAPLNTARAGHSATLLADGTVLVVGGDTGYGSQPTYPTASAERYDPRTDRWTAAASLAVTRAYHAAILLRDGRVLVVGGISSGPAPDYATTAVATAELYDPAANRWTTAASLGTLRGPYLTATMLPDGRVLVTGWQQDSTGALSTTGEVYLADADRWTPTPPLPTPRESYTATALPDGRVLVAGGTDLTNYRIASTVLYDPAQNVWTGAPPMTTARNGQAAVPLLDGRILVAGGDDTGSAEVYTGTPAPAACFPETGKCVSPRFFAYWQAHGGLAINGYPLSDDRIETLEDGRAYQVQYFERVRLEYHPENQPPYDILLGQFGRRILAEDYVVNRAGYDQATAPVSGSGPYYFPQTGHTIASRFAAYWEQNGGLMQFGYPITEERWDTLPIGAGACCITQYFERARFEWHPENEGSPYVVLLGQFGRRILDDNTALSGGFGQLFLSDEHVRRLLGRPLGAAVQSPGATQPFEGGRMLYAEQVPGFGHTIMVLCGAETSGRVISQQLRLFFTDTWEAGQDPGGGPAPAAGRYYPSRGFGKVWREHPEVQQCLGYATTAAETGFPITVQPFQGGYMVLSDTPAERAIYVIWGGYSCNSCGVEAFYERYADPTP